MSIRGKFSIGEMFPSFSWPLASGGRVTPAANPGWGLIVIYRGKHCPLCKRYLAELEKLKDEFASLGVAIWALSADPIERAQADAVEHGWTFPVLADLGEGQMRQLGLYMSTPRTDAETDRNFAEPAIFVLNPRGRVQVVDLSNAAFVRPDLKAVLNGLRFIIANTYPARGTAD
ncbi:MAG: AhpC/TSA family protein [Sphingomonadales bacterium]|nr:AhpC/TSA family protein [Sphingomonadales bacterium]